MSETFGPGVFRDADYYEVPEELKVYSWCPSPTPTVPATQVHLHIGAPPGPVFVMRFKSPRTLDQLIAALISHRADVWGQPKEEHVEQQKPSVGRIVHYQAYGTPGGEFQSVPRAAIVAEVHDAEKGDVTVVVLNPSGLFFNRVPYSADPKPGHWNWPPRA